MTTLAQMTEAQFQSQVVWFAKLCNWRCYHTHDSRRSDPGFPDLVLVRGNHIIFAELKRERGRMSSEQEDWIKDLREVSKATPHIWVRIWRPSDWDLIEESLR